MSLGAARVRLDLSGSALILLPAFVGTYGRSQLDLLPGVCPPWETQMAPVWVKG